MANSHTQYSSTPINVNGDGGSSLPHAGSDRPSNFMFPMSKGDGVDSYSKNSSLQKLMVDMSILPLLNDALELVSLPAPGSGPILIADLGSSSGPNSIHLMSRIVEKIRQRFAPTSADSISPPLEFQLLFNDLPSNDFNNLFQQFANEELNELFKAGVPGSFFERLFPRSTVHVFVSTAAIHFLSKVPDCLTDKSSPAFNKGTWFLDDTNSEAVAAYKEQASLDLKSFLHARAVELAPGGLLCFAGMRRSGDNPSKYWDDDDAMPYGLASITEALRELASKGIISEEQIDYVNLPNFRRSIDEVREDVMSFSSAYEVQILEALEVQPLKNTLVDNPSPIEAKKTLKTVCGLYKGVLGEFMKQHLGEERAQLLWECCEPIIERRVLPKVRATGGKSRMYFVALTRTATRME